MKTGTLASVYTVATVAVLLILTAWENAIAMFVVSALGIVVGLLTFGRSLAGQRTLALLLIACALAFAVAVLLLYR